MKVGGVSLTIQWEVQGWMEGLALVWAEQHPLRGTVYVPGYGVNETMFYSASLHMTAHLLAPSKTIWVNAPASNRTR